MTTCGFKCVIYTVHDFIFNHVCMNISTRFSSKKKGRLIKLMIPILQPKIPQIRKDAYIPITNPPKNCEHFLPLKRNDSPTKNQPGHQAHPGQQPKKKTRHRWDDLRHSSAARHWRLDPPFTIFMTLVFGKRGKGTWNPKQPFIYMDVW